MTSHASFPDLSLINKLSGKAGELGYEIVDLAGYLDLVEQQAVAQRKALVELTGAAQQVSQANENALNALEPLQSTAESTIQSVEASAKLVQSLGQKSRGIAGWVGDLGPRTRDIGETVLAIKKNNIAIDSIALQVTTLAINAKIEAARAGDSGRGFAVVAESINELSRQTKAAAGEISSNIEALTSWITALGKETKDIAKQAQAVIENAGQTDSALQTMIEAAQSTQERTKDITSHATATRQAAQVFGPAMDALTDTVKTTSDGVVEARTRIEHLIDTSEAMVQSSAALGGTTEDAPFIEFVKGAAETLSDALERALDQGDISEVQLFTRRYAPVPGTDPEQVMAPFTELFDRVLPPIQEPALDFDPKVVFCAAVDQNGYLPTHNKKFAKPQSNDPVWNTANCRNRRIFDDRVGLKAGRNTEPFLLQVYRRDMGGGAFKMMKDLSAPIFVRKRHWGGLRFAYTF